MSGEKWTIGDLREAGFFIPLPCRIDGVEMVSEDDTPENFSKASKIEFEAGAAVEFGEADTAGGNW